ncbi:MAG TPA: hypothetical protein VF192_12450 [Longimicrobiales bacterium]
MARGGKTLRAVLLESGLIVFSILLALAVDGWRERRGEAQLARRALRSFELEIRQNKRNIEEVLPYHRTLAASVRRADSLGRIRNYADWKEQLPEFSGFHPPDLPATAWQSALAVGALASMGYDTVAALSKLYYYQGKLDAFTHASLTGFDFSDSRIPATVRQAYVYLATVVPNEENLLDQYDEVLRLIARDPAGVVRRAEHP